MKKITWHFMALALLTMLTFELKAQHKRDAYHINNTGNDWFIESNKGDGSLSGDNLYIGRSNGSPHSKYLTVHASGVFEIHRGEQVYLPSNNRIATSSGNMGFLVNADRKMTILGSGSVGIGTTDPTSHNINARLTVKNGDIEIQNGSFTSYGEIVFQPDTDANGDDEIIFKNNSKNETMRIHSNDNVGIGTNSPSAKLHVNGTAKFTGALTGTSAEFTGAFTGTSGTFSGAVNGNGATFKTLHLTIGSFPDYVFAKGYDLMPLEQVEAYINAHHHLPKVPKAEKVIKDGMNVGQINVLLVEKVEELTLHTIAQHKQLKQQNQQMKALLKRLEKLEKQQKNK